MDKLRKMSRAEKILALTTFISSFLAIIGFATSASASTGLNSMQSFVALIDKYGLPLIAVVVLSIALIWYSDRLAKDLDLMIRTQNEQFAQMFEALMNKSKDTLPIDLSAHLVHQVPWMEKISHILQILVDDLHSDRVILCLFHNGGVVLDRIQFIYLSTAVEVLTDDAMMPKYSQLKRIPAHLFPSLMSLLIKGEIVASADVHLMPFQERYLLSSEGIKSAILVGLYDTHHNPFGFIVISWEKQQLDSIPALSIARAKQSAATIEGMYTLLGDELQVLMTQQEVK